MAAVPKAFATAADIRIRAMSFLNRRHNLFISSAAFAGAFVTRLMQNEFLADTFL
jgi:hypothetical protein